MTILQKYSSHNYFQVEDYCFAFALLHLVFLMKIDLDFSKASDLMCPLMLTQPSLSAAKGGESHIALLCHCFPPKIF